MAVLFVNTKPRKVYSCVVRCSVRTCYYSFGKSTLRVDYGRKGVTHSKLLALVFLQVVQLTQHVLMKG